MVAIRIDTETERKIAALMLATGRSASSVARQLLSEGLAKAVSSEHLKALEAVERKQGNGDAEPVAPKRRGRPPKATPAGLSL